MGPGIALPPALPLVAVLLTFAAAPAPAGAAASGGPLAVQEAPVHPPAADRGQPPRLRAVRIEAEEAGAIRLDGRLDEPAWRRAEPITELRQREPDEGAPATEATEVRVLYDDRALYVGIRALDREPASVVARILQRDRIMETAGGLMGLRFTSDDGVAILLDPFHDRRNAVVFAVNPNGAKFDALITDEGRQVNADWRGVWDVAARRTADGWTAEIEIPFRSLRYPSSAEERTWGFNVFRLIRRKNEEVLWSSWARTNEGFARVSRAGHLEGLRNLPRRGLNLEAKPFLLAGGIREADPAAAPGAPGAAVETDPRLDVGLDLKYELRPGLVLDATVNPDFAQVEADDEQVNLTRFDLFFPEKRDFFLENAGIFEFGMRGFGEPPPFLLFFSRRIGIDGGGEVPVLGGARLTGRAGRQTVGALNVVTDGSGGTPDLNHAVARVQRDVGESGYVGAMLTDLRRSGHRNTSGGLDWSLWPLDGINLLGFLAATSTSGPGGDDVAYRVAVDHTGDRYGFLAQHIFVGPDANPELGFVTRTDLRRTDLFLRHSPRPAALALRKVDIRASGTHILSSDGRLQDWEASLMLNPEWRTGEEASLRWERGFTRLSAPFELADGVTVPTGDYPGWQLRLTGSTSPGRAVRLQWRASRQRLFDGRLLSAGATVSSAPWRGARVSLGFSRNDVEVPGGDFTADLASLRTGWALSTRLSLDALLQYNSLDRRASANLRLRFIHRPGSDLYLVLNEERGGIDSAWDFRSRGAVAKLTWLARF